MRELNVTTSSCTLLAAEIKQKFGISPSMLMQVREKSHLGHS